MSAPAAAAAHARLYDGETFEHQGYTFRVRFERDDDMGEPWAEHDGHGPVSEWTTRSKRPGERVLSEDQRSRRYYDFAAAVQIARRDGWGSTGDEGLPAGEKAARAAERDYEYLRGWCRDEWEWTCVYVEQVEDGRPTRERASLSGVDGDHDGGQYLTECAYELAGEIVSRLEVDTPDVVRSDT